MSYETLISSDELFQHLGESDWLIIDCRFSLADTDRGRLDYHESHIPGAIYAHLDDDLSAPVIPGVTGRHPLPGVDEAANVFSNFGISSGIQVVAYDDAGGALAAVRVWWMLRWLGHTAAAVLDGGWQKWCERGFPTRSGREVQTRRLFIPSPRPELIVDTQKIDLMRQNPDCLVVDARAAERFYGKNETIDPVAGHIPGAVSAPYMENLNEEGEFRSREELQEKYKALIGDRPIKNVVFYCGSGVTSIHNILAMLYAGLGEGRLYAGSWSEWITDPKRPVTIE
jgi:thiosulfate/3-mercaptopyruvate sulfurtransferase